MKKNSLERIVTMHHTNIPSEAERPTFYEIKEIEEELYLKIVCNETE